MGEDTDTDADSRSYETICQKAKDLLSDKKIPRPGFWGFALSDYLSDYKRYAVQTLRWADAHEYFTEERIAATTRQYELYQKIKQLNESYPPDLYLEAVSVLEHVAKVSARYAKTDRSLRTTRQNMMTVANVLKGNQYYWWHKHIEKADRVLEQLAARGARFKTLPRKVKKLMARTKV